MKSLLLMYVKLQWRKSFLIYPLSVFFLDFMFSRLSSRMSPIALFVPIFFFRKFLYPIKSSEIHPDLIYITRIPKEIQLKLHNFSFMFWFSLGIVISILFKYFTITKEIHYWEYTTFACTTVSGLTLGNLFSIQGSISFLLSLLYTIIYLVVISITFLIAYWFTATNNHLFVLSMLFVTIIIWTIQINYCVKNR